MKRNSICLISTLLLVMLLIFGVYSTTVIAQDDPPTPEILFEGHDFSETYWDVMIFNNSNWDHEDIDPMVSWLNNTWNVKWMQEGNFEMGMLAFMNKTMIDYDSGEEVIYTTPAQMWWQHAYLAGSEIWVAAMHTAWFGFEDDNGNGYYDAGDEISPFFFMGAQTEGVRNASIYSNPTTTADPLQRSVSGSTITYNWGYNYEDIIFYVPEINRSAVNEFEWGFNYSDPGTYAMGSHHIGNVTYFSYEYTLDIDLSAGEATLYQDYELGEIGAMAYRDDYGHLWSMADYDDHWVTENFSLCLGTWSFIYAEQDWALSTPFGTITRENHTTGLNEVLTTLGGVHAFDFKFSRKPQYQIANATETTLHTHDVSYQTMDVATDAEFIDFVSGMTDLVGEFGRLVCGYVINQTNRFTYGIPMEEAYNETDPENMAAFFVTCYPEYGAYRGGRLIHDPVFTAYFTPKSAIPGYHIAVLCFTTILGISIVLLSKRKFKIIKN
jgi:hypothetical protein